MQNSVEAKKGFSEALIDNNGCSIIEINNDDKILFSPIEEALE